MAEHDLYNDMRRYSPNRTRNLEPPKSAYTQISQSALSYNATSRIMELSKPKIKKDNLIRDGKLIKFNAFINYNSLKKFSLYLQFFRLPKR